MTAPPAAGAALERRLGLRDAVVLGLGGMIGTGIFVVAAPVARVAGDLLLLSLLVAAVVAAANATSSARLAARYPVSGGAYHWGRELLHPAAGLLAGWCFVVGKVASSAAAALTVGLYVAAAAGAGRVVVTVAALVVVAAVTTANVLGIKRTARASLWLVSFVVAVLLLLVVVGLGSLTGAGDGAPAGDGAGAPGVASPSGVVAGAGLFFLAFAGYARIATLGEEVRDPRRTIPRAVAAAFALTVTLYLLVVVTLQSVLTTGELAGAAAPLADLADAVGAGWLRVLVGLAGVAAAGAVALGVQAGVSRVLLAMSRTGDLPGVLAVLHPVRRTPYRADLLVGVAVAVVVVFGGIVGAIVVSAATVLTYYAVANAAALRLPGAAGRVVAVLGLVGCAVLAVAVVAFVIP